MRVDREARRLPSLERGWTVEDGSDAERVVVVSGAMSFSIRGGAVMGGWSSRKGVRYWTWTGSVEDENIARLRTAAGAGAGAKRERLEPASRSTNGKLTFRPLAGNILEGNFIPSTSNTHTPLLLIPSLARCSPFQTPRHCPDSTSSATRSTSVRVHLSIDPLLLRIGVDNRGAVADAVARRPFLD